MDVFCNMLFRCCCSMEYKSRVDETDKLKRYFINKIERQQYIITNMLQTIEGMAYNDSDSINNIRNLILLQTSSISKSGDNLSSVDNLHVITTNDTNDLYNKCSNKVIPEFSIVGESKIE